MDEDKSSEAEPPPSPQGAPADNPPPKAKPRRRWLRRALVVFLVVVFILPIGTTALYRFVPPPIDILMIQRLIAGRGMDYRWVPMRRISPALVAAAIASEDGKFCTHHGFDFEAINKAMARNAKGGRVRGGSTISQQTAKNVFLWPQRDWVRKGAEVYFTVLTETLWGKKRIMEVYLNVAEMGPGIYGAEAASERYFKTSARNLTQAQAARLVAVLPNPIKYKAGNPGPYVSRRTASVTARAGVVRREGYADCVLSD